MIGAEIENKTMVRNNKRDLETNMKAVCVCLTMIAALSVCAMENNQFNIMIKKMEHIAMVQRKPAITTKQCLLKLQEEQLTEKQTSQLQEL